MGEESEALRVCNICGFEEYCEYGECPFCIGKMWKVEECPVCHDLIYTKNRGMERHFRREHVRL